MSQNSEEEFALERLVFTTKAKTSFEWLRRWGRSQVFWPFAFGGACCSLEYNAAFGPRYNLAAHGVKIERVSPAQADLMIVAGTVTEKIVPFLKSIYNQMPDPKWVIAFGACAASGGLYSSYHVVQGIGREIPVDVYIPGCPPTPEALMEGISLVKERVSKGISASDPIVRKSES